MRSIVRRLDEAFRLVVLFEGQAHRGVERSRGMHRKARGRSRLSIALGVAVVVVLAVLGSATRPADSGAAGSTTKISTGVIDATENGQETSFVVYMNEQADLSAAASMTDEDAR